MISCSLAEVESVHRLHLKPACIGECQGAGGRFPPVGLRFRRPSHVVLFHSSEGPCLLSCRLCCDMYTLICVQFILCEYVHFKKWDRNKNTITMTIGPFHLKCFPPEPLRVFNKAMEILPSYHDYITE